MGLGPPTFSWQGSAARVGATSNTSYGPEVGDRHARTPRPCPGIDKEERGHRQQRGLGSSGPWTVYDTSAQPVASVSSGSKGEVGTCSCEPMIARCRSFADPTPLRYFQLPPLSPDWIPNRNPYSLHPPCASLGRRSGRPLLPALEQRLGMNSSRTWPGSRGSEFKVRGSEGSELSG